MFKNKYRVVGDNYLGYEIQVKRWWLPLWFQAFGVNTFSSIDSAKRTIERMTKVHAFYVADL